jgi:hypothetical protein
VGDSDVPIDVSTRKKIMKISTVLMILFVCGATLFFLALYEEGSKKGGEKK